MPVIDIQATGKNIERLRKAAGLSVKDMQAAFGFSTPQAIYKWQQGACMPTIDNIVIMAVMFGCRVDDIVVVTMP